MLPGACLALMVLLLHFLSDDDMNVTVVSSADNAMNLWPHQLPCNHRNWHWWQGSWDCQVIALPGAWQPCGVGHVCWHDKVLLIARHVQSHYSWVLCYWHNARVLPCDDWCHYSRGLTVQTWASFKFLRSFELMTIYYAKYQHLFNRTLGEKPLEEFNIFLHTCGYVSGVQYLPACRCFVHTHMSEISPGLLQCMCQICNTHACGLVCTCTPCWVFCAYYSCL